jgi:ADP-sugar diphosphatase
MASFLLDEADGFGKPVKVILPAHVNIEEDQLLSFAAFRDWISTLTENLKLQKTTADHPFRDDPYRLLSIEIQSVDFFGREKIGFLKLKATLENKAKSTLPGIAFLRGGSVAVLMVLRAKNHADERYVVLTEQPRVPAGSLQFLEIPAGMLDGETGFSGKAAQEIEEETGITIPKDELINMTELALKESEVRDTSLKAAMYPSPGGSDEFIPVFLWEKVSTGEKQHDRRTY